MKIIPKFKNGSPISEDEEYEQAMNTPYMLAHPELRVTKELYFALKAENERRLGTITKTKDVNPISRAINNYFGELNYRLLNGEALTPKYEIPAIVLGTAAIMNPISTIGAMIGGKIGGTVVDAQSKFLTGNTWALNVSNLTGLDPLPAQLTNPGEWFGAGRGALLSNIASKSGKTFVNTAGKTFVTSKIAGNTTPVATVDAIAATPAGKRLAEVAMRSRYDTHATPNPIPDMLQGWMASPWNRRRAVLDYILTGGKYSSVGNKPFGYMQSLAPFKLPGTRASQKEISEGLIGSFKLVTPKLKMAMLLREKTILPNKTTYNWGPWKGEPEVAYTGGFWETHFPRKSGYGDAIDAYLYGTEIDPAYGMTRLSVGNPEDFGLHSDYIKSFYPERASRILVYQTVPHPENELVTEPIEIYGNSEKTGNIYTSSSVFDAAGHRLEGGNLLNVGDWPKILLNDGTIVQRAPSVYRHLDLWLFNSRRVPSNKGYMEKWKDLGDLENTGQTGILGIRLIDKAGTPFITRTPWMFNINLIIH